MGKLGSFSLERLLLQLLVFFYLIMVHFLTNGSWTVFYMIFKSACARYHLLFNELFDACAVADILHLPVLVLEHDTLAEMTVHFLFCQFKPHSFLSQILQCLLLLLLTDCLFDKESCLEHLTVADHGSVPSVTWVVGFLFVLVTFLYQNVVSF